ncbi:Putative Riboflavin synthase alpha chain [[Torrubiella] hemipterigena]|uniref:Riboflavin synthase n=1 Tax=[Torrubiella] hemipterigena TaxID=1531966 RepID=A0A0A1TL77_9HYPO|nr:Putative Riboflavin synthase alpha chain [[Torrubiella] hemipterigena]
MFTGLVEEIGVLSKIVKDEATNSSELTISVPSGSGLLADCHDGDSIAVNGCCLTVTSFTATEFTVGVAPETLRVTNLGTLVESGRVNLERAIRADTRMGGHIVQGHVDTTAEILSVQPDGNALTFRFKPQKPEFLKYIVHKGFIAIDGTSLTITQVNDAEGWWEIMMIVYTQDKVVVAQKKAGELVNIEVDMMAKYAEKSLISILGGSDGQASIPLLEKMIQRIVEQHTK